MAQVNDPKNVQSSTEAVMKNASKVAEGVASAVVKGGVNKDISVKQWSRLQGYAWGIAGVSMLSAFILSRMMTSPTHKHDDDHKPRVDK